ncbi:hypothetical protein [Flavobacterium tructae]|uniref:hypothetical protein n=1 Tax=Flavobacterium tructae TaxID=1114873 RepID=UPI0035A8F948
MKILLNLRAALLLVMIVILSLVSAYYNFSIENNTKDILKANYNTLDYSGNMLLSLDKMNSDKENAILVFQNNLARQMENITEVGEQKVTYDLQVNFDALKSNWKDENLKSKIRQDIFHIIKLNMAAIKKKSDIVTHTTERANFWIAILGALCFLIAFNLILKLFSSKQK